MSVVATRTKPPAARGAAQTMASTRRPKATAEKPTHG